MINTDVSKVVYTTVSGSSHVYPVPFKVLTNMETGLPALSVVKGGNPLVYNKGYTYTSEGVVLLNNQASGETLEISQGQPFTQNIDLKFGLIDPEQIESGFDQSVIRDQQVRDATKAAQDTADEAATDAATALDTANTAKATADTAKQTAAEAKSIAEAATKKAVEAGTTANNATTTANTAKTTADAAQTTANAALDAVADKQDIIPDLATIRAGAAKGATAVQPSAITDMETKTHAAATYQPKGDYATKATTDTLRNDVDGLGDQVHEIEAKIPGNASPANQLATKSDIANIDALPAQAGNAGKFLSTDGTTASWKSVPGGGSSTDNNGLEGDYCSKYGIVDETKSGLPYQGTGNQVIIPAQLQLGMYGAAGLTTITGNVTVDLTVTTNCELWLESITGTVYQATKTYWQENEPAESSDPCVVWISSTGTHVKSNDTGNVFRKTNITRVVKCIFTDGNLTRLCFTGCRVLNKQDYVPISDRSMATEDSAYVYLGVSQTAKGKLFDCVRNVNTVYAKRFTVDFNSVGDHVMDGARHYRFHYTGSDGTAGEVSIRPISGGMSGVKYFAISGDGAPKVWVPTTSGTLAIAEDASTTSTTNTWSAKKLNDTIGNVETLLNKLNTGA